MDSSQRHRFLADYASGAVTAVELRRRLGGATYGEILSMLAQEGLTLPHAPVAGREDTIARARAWLFPQRPDG